MNKTIIIGSLIAAALCLTGCESVNTSETDTASSSEITTTTELPEQTETTTELTTTTTATAPTTSTTAAETTTEVVTTQIRTPKLDRIADSMDEPTDIPAPCGDISNAYVCFGGTALYPAVRVLSSDEVRKLSKIMNSMEWTEFPEKPATPPTPGPDDLTLYINDNGKRYQLDLLSDTYQDENSVRYFRVSSPSTSEETFSIYDLMSDLLFTGPHSDVTTHLYMQTELFKSEEDFDINAYWDLIWDDVIPYIEEGIQPGEQQ